MSTDTAEPVANGTVRMTFDVPRGHYLKARVKQEGEADERWQERAVLGFGDDRRFAIVELPPEEQDE